MQNYRQEVEAARAKVYQPLKNFVKQTLSEKLGSAWQQHVKEKLQPATVRVPIELDMLLCLRILDLFWNEIFKNIFSDKKVRSLANEAIAIRNDYAHDRNFTLEDTERALDTYARLLRAIRAESAAQQIAEMRRALLIKSLEHASTPLESAQNKTSDTPHQTHSLAQTSPSKTSKRTITEEQAMACYEQFLLAYKHQISFDQAVEKPVSLGMNKSSAWRYIAITLKGLAYGETYKSTVNLRDQAMFLNFIMRDFGEAGLRRALQAYEGHIDYLENETGVNHPRRRKQLAEFKKRLA